MAIETDVHIHELVVVSNTTAALVQGKHEAEVVLVEQMSAVWRQEESTDETIGDTGVVQDAKLSHKVTTVGVVLNVLDDLVRGRTHILDGDWC